MAMYEATEKIRNVNNWLRASFLFVCFILLSCFARFAGILPMVDTETSGHANSEVLLTRTFTPLHALLVLNAYKTCFSQFHKNAMWHHSHCGELICS